MSKRIQPGAIASGDKDCDSGQAQAEHGGAQGDGAAEDEDFLASGLTDRRGRSPGELDLLVIGELNVDLIVDCGEVLPQFGQVDQLIGPVKLTIGSSGAITAVAAARLGLRTAIIGVVADDEFGRFMLAALRSDGVDVSGCLIRPDGRTGATVILARGADRAMLTSPGLIGDLAAAEVDAGLLAAAHHVHVSSIYLQRRLQAGLPALLTAVSRGGAVSSLDPGWDPEQQWLPPLRQALARCDYFLPNEQEACRIAGSGDVTRAAGALVTAGPAVVIKRGGDGVLVHDGARVRSLATEAVRVLDATGAGDNFDAGFIAGLTAGLDLPTASALGAACGTISTQGYGGTGRTATRAEAWRLASVLMQRNGTSPSFAEER